MLFKISMVSLFILSTSAMAQTSYDAYLETAPYRMNNDAKVKGNAAAKSNTSVTKNDACMKYEKLTGSATVSGAKFNVTVYLVAGQTFVYAPKIVEVGNQVLTNFYCSYKPSNVTCNYERYEKNNVEPTVIYPDPMTSNYMVINNEPALYNKVDGKVVIPVTAAN